MPQRNPHRFQLTHSRGVRHDVFSIVAFVFIFQLTHSRGVRRMNSMAIRKLIYFNSRTHVECDQSTRYFCIACTEISTHALTWSATTEDIARMVQICISTHALTWSATHAMSVEPTPVEISTHALTWSATEVWNLRACPQSISTHALTWSATCQSFGMYKTIDFNSRTHVECDIMPATKP